MTIVEGAFGTLSQFKVAKDISKMIRLYDDEYGPFHRPWDVLFETDGPGKGKYLSVAKRLSSGCVEISYSDLQQFVLVNIERRILLNQSSSMSSIRDSVYKKVIFFSLIHHPDVPPIYPFKPHIVSDLESSPSEGPVVSPRGSEHPSELASHVDHDESNNTVCRDLQVTGLIYINKLYSHRAGLCTQRLEMSQVLPGQPVLTISAKTLVLTRWDILRSELHVLFLNTRVLLEFLTVHTWSRGSNLHGCCWRSKVCCASCQQSSLWYGSSSAEVLPYTEKHV